LIAKHRDLVRKRDELRSAVRSVNESRQRAWRLAFGRYERYAVARKEAKVVEHRFPETARLALTTRTKTGLKKPAAKTLSKLLISRLQPALALQLARAMAEADCFDLVDAIAVNGWVDFFERSTGQPRRAYCVSLIASKAALLAVRVETADLVAAFNSLRGASAGDTYEVAPVMPSLRFDKTDPRFVESRDTLQTMREHANLAAMKWEDFEHLIRELFELEFAASGAEVKVTRVSRDHGVDAIIFDPDPIRGGKIAIQAKRYTIPVDVSAVRDLYGTVVNEGANTGILVTTSSFGPDAYRRRAACEHRSSSRYGHVL